MLKHGEVNPLAVFGLRQLEHCPPHFTKVQIQSLDSSDKHYSDWIWENLTGRFYFGDEYTITESKTVDMHKIAAFEIPGEASVFALMQDRIAPSPF